MREFEPEIEAITLAPSEGGRYEIMVNDYLVYSKLETGRHAEQGEVTMLVRKYLREGK